ncbi:isochorismate synthase DhbC [Teredinibacter turnerae T7901]|uniref:isochorismate synthase n=1 Tax=Teredinibacter turnerae (strain ATCC 39867 / T7901) TaxID=377629 RepID=C5BUB6_TERTT|nr:isochorismate synthase [Teredinibacter turnerae]ACR13729.1 isochorismate synthase DhbC [Teredinibacter turnerae T7901]
MSVTFAESRLSAHAIPTASNFTFCSSHRKLHTTGIAENLHLPIFEHNTTQRFTKSLRSAFQRAHANGISNPIVVGAIPFDLTQPCSLFIPVESHFGTTPIVNQFSKRDPIEIVNRRSFPEEARYKQSVKQAIANFQLSDIRKAVLSRVLELDLNTQLPANTLFHSLQHQNPTGYHFSVPLEDGGQLVGVSPELLIRKEAEWITSNPLAGSTRRLRNADDDTAAALALQSSHKDLYEHRLVIEEINRVLQPFCSELDIPAAPSLLNTETMWHLSTLIRGRLSNANISALDIASALHPTPAVCGYPTPLAHKLINLVESFDRGLFAGMVGWQDSDGNGEWAVTIRCGIVRGNQVSLFAGAGIVEDSCPESEWAETQAKLQTMLKALPIQANAEAAQ